MASGYAFLAILFLVGVAIGFVIGVGYERRWWMRRVSLTRQFLRNPSGGWGGLL